MRPVLPALLCSILTAPAASAQQVEIEAAYTMQAGGGYNGVVLMDIAGQTEFLMNGYEFFDLREAGYWFSRRHDPVSGEYRTHLMGGARPELVACSGKGDVHPDPGLEYVRMHHGGLLEILDPETGTLLDVRQTSMGSPKAMEVRDIDFDGRDDIIVVSLSRLVVFGGAGGTLLTTGVLTGWDLAVGQMDADPAIEIATGDGRILDTMSGNVQYHSPNSFGEQLTAGDLDGDGMDELVYSWVNGITHLLDVDTATVRWALPGYEVGRMRVLDLDGDGTVELALGRKSYHGIDVYDAAGPTLLWNIPTNSFTYSVADFDAADLDGDGAIEVVWSSDQGVSVVDAVTGVDEWALKPARAPLFGPVLADLDADGTAEVVVVERNGDGFVAGRILVFDQALQPLGVSPFPLQASSIPLRGFRVADHDGDGAQEVVVAGAKWGDSLVEIWGWSPGGGFVLEWSSPSPTPSTEAAVADVLDVDGDGALEVVSYMNEGSSPNDGFVQVCDHLTGAVEWNSTTMSADDEDPVMMEIADLDADGNLEILVATFRDEARIYDAVTRTEEAVLPGQWTCATVLPAAPGQPPAFVLGDRNGAVTRFQALGAGYPANLTLQVGVGTVDGITLKGNLAYVAVGGRLRAMRLDAPGQWIGPSPFYGQRVGTELGFGAPGEIFVNSLSRLLKLSVQ